MDEKEITSFIAEFESYMASVITSKEKARKFLQDAGIYTKKGRLRKEYRSPSAGLDARWEYPVSDNHVITYCSFNNA